MKTFISHLNKYIFNMNTKKIFGIPIVALLMGLMIIGGVSAVIVGYLSNTATMSVDVESPIVIGFAEVDHGETVTSAIVNTRDGSVTWSPTLTAGAITGLSTLDLGLSVEVSDTIDEDITNKILLVSLSNDLNDVTCADLTSLTFIDVGVSSTSAYYHVVQELTGIGLCTENVDGTIDFAVPINSLAPGDVNKYPVTMSFGNVAPSTYVVSAVLNN